MRQRLCIVVLLAGCPSGSEDDTADTSTGVAETSTGPASTESLSETTPSTSGDPTTMSSMSMSGTETETTDATTEPTTETGPTGCESSEECTDAANPVCVDDVCVPCTEAGDGDALCASKDDEAPACGASGECVECTDGNPVACDGMTPICDAGSSSCVGCTYHEQCDTACNMATGGCFGDCVNVVEDDEQSIQAAIEDGCVVQVGAGAYAEAVVVDSGFSVAIIGVDEDVFLQGIGGANGQPGLSVLGGANVFVENLEISGNDGGGVGVSVSGASVWLDRSELVTNSGGGLVLTSNANAVVRNCFVQGSSDDAAGIEVNSSRAEVLYTTIGGIDDGFGGGGAVRCFEPTEFTIRNSLLFKTGMGAEIVCADVDVSYTALENAFDGDGNVDLGNVMPGWFEGLAAGNYALVGPPDDLLTAAQWRTADPAVDPPRLANDPATDIDGTELRPTVDGTADVAGADIP